MSVCLDLEMNSDCGIHLSPEFFLTELIRFSEFFGS